MSLNLLKITRVLVTIVKVVKELNPQLHISYPPIINLWNGICFSKIEWDWNNCFLNEKAEDLKFFYYLSVKNIRNIF